MDGRPAKGGLLADKTRSAFLGNRLVLIAPAGKGGQVTTRTLGRTLSAGPLAMADTDSVPAGKYGKAALEKLGAWTMVAPHVVRAENVRAALALVERGAAPMASSTPPTPRPRRASAWRACFLRQATRRSPIRSPG
ncbi:hypothetical protein GCM10020258_37070 [Sphingomonas yabuuchiae]